MLKNRYQFQRKLGEGIYGTVTLALDTHTGQSVAIKRQKPDNFDDQREGLSIALIREINILQELGQPGNPHLVSLIDVFPLGDGSPCLVIEHLAGGSLSDLLQSEVHLKPQHIKNLCHQLLSAIQYMHCNFVMHRDLKPDNVMLTADGQLKLIDFGMAK